MREWLEAQAVCGILEVRDGRYTLRPEHAVALLERESLAYVAPMARLLPALAGALRPLIDAFRTGGGVPYEVYGAEFREGQQDFTRPQYVNGLDGILAGLPAVDARLRARPPPAWWTSRAGRGSSASSWRAATRTREIEGDRPRRGLDRHGPRERPRGGPRGPRALPRARREPTRGSTAPTT